jgi:hypothetical protein
VDIASNHQIIESEKVFNTMRTSTILYLQERNVIRGLYHSPPLVTVDSAFYTKQIANLTGGQPLGIKTNHQVLAQLLLDTF